MVCILTEPNYSNSIWCRNFLNSLIEALRKNRIPFCEIFDEIPENAEDVFIIASDLIWIKNTIKQLNKSDISPILICNHIEEITSCEYSCVSSDIGGSIKSFLKQISDRKQQNIAIYGVNTSSVSDIGKVDTLFSHNDNLFQNINIYNNEGSLSDCFLKFSKDIKNTNTVICTNDFAAISLIKHLEKSFPEKLAGLTVFSLTDSTLSAYYRKYITSVNINYNGYGKTAVFLYKSRKKHKYLSNMTIKVSWSIEENKRSKALPITLNVPQPIDNFYGDIEFSEMMKLEKLLNSCDATDSVIINGLLKGFTNEQIINNCYMTENAVKYRIKKLLSECDITDKAELLTLCKKYIVPVWDGAL